MMTRPIDGLRVNPHRIIILALFLGILLRLYFIVAVWSSGWLEAPVLDPRTFIETARMIVEQGFQAAGVTWRPPLYPLFLAGHFRLTGENLLWPLVTQGMLGVLMLPILYGIGTHLAGRLPAALSVLLYAVCGPAVFFGGQVLSETLFLFLIYAGLYLVLLAGNRGHPFVMLAGFSCGAALLTRPQAAPVVLAWLLGLTFASPARSIGHKAGRAFLFLAPVLLLLAPVVAHNFRVTGGWMGVSPLGAYNFFVGNNRQADGKTVWSSKTALDHLGVAPDLDPRESSRLYRQAAFREIREDPLIFVGRLGIKLYYLIHRQEIPSNVDMVYWMEYQSPWLRPMMAVSMGNLLPLALLGLCSLPLNRTWPLVVFMLMYGATLLIFFVNARLRLPLLPGLCLLAPCGLRYLAQGLRSPHLRTGALSLSGLLLLQWGISRTHWYGVANTEDRVWINSIQGARLWQLGHSAQSLHLVHAMLAEDPLSGDLHFLAAVNHLDLGNHAQAARHRRILHEETNLRFRHVSSHAVRASLPMEAGGG